MESEVKEVPKTEIKNLHQHAHEYLLKMIESGMLAENPYNNVNTLPELAYELAKKMDKIKTHVEYSELSPYSSHAHVFPFIKHDDNQQ